MVDVVITYETLFDVLRKEKSREELQQLPTDFYGQVIVYLRQKQADVTAAGGYSSPAAQKPLIQFRNVQKILRELYERRERKILEMALNRARTERNLVDTTALLLEERRFFEDASEQLKAFRLRLLEPILRGEVPDGTVVPERAVLEENEREAGPREQFEASGGAREGAEPDEQNPEPRAPAVEDVSSKERCAVRFTAAVPKFLGLHGEVHGPFEPGDTAELPGKIAAVLIRKKRVELQE